jgi:hypothetical protein
MNRINEIFQLNETPGMQDWEIECSDPNRVHEFINEYRTLMKDDDEKFAMMSLILWSYEEYHRTHIEGDDAWKQIKDILENDYAILSDLVKYYSCEDASNDDAEFPFTKLMRTVAPPKWA